VKWPFMLGSGVPGTNGGGALTSRTAELSGADASVSSRLNPGKQRSSHLTDSRRDESLETGPLKMEESLLDAYFGDPYLRLDSVG
jgi:hypothetical protein